MRVSQHFYPFISRKSTHTEVTGTLLWLNQTARAHWKAWHRVLFQTDTVGPHRGMHHPVQRLHCALSIMWSQLGAINPSFEEIPPFKFTKWWWWGRETCSLKCQRNDEIEGWGQMCGGFWFGSASTSWFRAMWSFTEWLFKADIKQNGDNYVLESCQRCVSTLCTDCINNRNLSFSLFFHPSYRSCMTAWL